MFIKPFVALLAAITASAAPAANVARDDGKWEITQLYTHTPSGRPGNSPYSYVNTTIQDATASSISNCYLQYIDRDAPWGVEQPCTTEGGNSTWAFTLNYPTSGNADASTNFNLEFKVWSLENTLLSNFMAREAYLAQLIADGKTYTGGDHFEVWQNMAGQCGGSGVCSWSLQDTPYAIAFTESTS